MESLRHVPGAERLDHAPVPIDRVNVLGVRHANTVRVSMAASLARVGETDPLLCPSCQAHEPGSQEPLQIDDQIELPLTQFAAEGERVRAECQMPS